MRPPDLVSREGWAGVCDLCTVPHEGLCQGVGQESFQRLSPLLQQVRPAGRCRGPHCGDGSVTALKISTTEFLPLFCLTPTPRAGAAGLKQRPPHCPASEGSGNWSLVFTTPSEGQAAHGLILPPVNARQHIGLDLRSQREKPELFHGNQKWRYHIGFPGWRVGAQEDPHAAESRIAHDIRSKSALRVRGVLFFASGSLL